MAKQSSKTEESKLDKIRNFLGIGHKSSIHTSATSHYIPPRNRKQFFVAREVVRDIGPASQTNQRLKALRDLCETVHTRRLEENGAEVLWSSVQDLLRPNISSDVRHQVLHFLLCLVQGQYEELGMMRGVVFQFIKTHSLFEDLPLRLEVFKALSSDGRDLQYFEEETGPFLAEWMKDIMSSKKISDFLQLATNVVKYNAAYLDEDIIASIVLNTCIIATTKGHEEDIELCIKVLGTVVCYSYLPAKSLHHFVVCLCRVVNVKKYCQQTWTLMRKLLGTHLGHSGVRTMCCILQDKNNTTDSGSVLLRGAVFFVGMALWGSQKLTSLKHPPAAVLPSFLQALEHSQSTIVSNEVLLSVQRLVGKYGSEQEHLAWDAILDIIHFIVKLLATQSCPVPVEIELHGNVHKLLTNIESLEQQNQFSGDQDYLFSIIQACAQRRPESSILGLISHKARLITAGNDDWIQSLNQLIDIYFKQDSRCKVRVKVLDVISDVFEANCHAFEDEMMTQVVLPCLGKVDEEPDTEVRRRSTQFLVDIARDCQSQHCQDVLNLLRSILNRPTTANVGTAHSVLGERRGSLFLAESEDLRVAVCGLVDVFKKKLFAGDVTLTLTVFEYLVAYLKENYINNLLLLQAGSIRTTMIELFLDMRADEAGHIGLASEDTEGDVVYSPHVLCCENEFPMYTSDSLTGSATTLPSNVIKPCVLSYADAFSCLTKCLQEELDWLVLKLVLSKMPLLLQNKTLVLSAELDDIRKLCGRLCDMLSEKNTGLPEKLLNTPAKFSKSDFHSHILPVLTSFVAYHSLLDKPHQTNLVRCLEFGLVSKCPRVCVRALNVCALEMQDVLMRRLPATLLTLSKISATVAMAIPLMEFLSSLIHLPQLYANFVEDHYMSIFAIALPYTDPFKYSHYTVSLSYHVIAMWFLKCRLSFRKGFVGFIIKGLKANVLRQFKENSHQRVRASNEGLERSRTQSLNDEALRNRSALPAESTGTVPDSRTKAAALLAKQKVATASAVDENMRTFHKELTDTCCDMMARYTFSNCSSMPARSPVSKFLLDGGQCQSWLLGNRIITITTSGGYKVRRAGLCDRCLLLARAASFSMEPAPPEPAPQGRRRHKTAAPTTKTEKVTLKKSSKDDLLLHRASPPKDSDSLTDVSTGGSGQDLSHSSSLDTRSDKIQAMDSVLMGLQAKPSDRSIFSPHMCSCWCTQWAEIHVRRPTGNLSWMMRIQNQQDVADAFPEFPLADISNLFMTSSENINTSILTEKKIDGLSLGENEYESLHDEHFYGSSQDSSCQLMGASLSSQFSGGTFNGDISPEEPSDTKQFSEAESMAHFRRSASSPDLIVHPNESTMQDSHEKVDGDMPEPDEKTPEINTCNETPFFPAVQSVSLFGENTPAIDIDSSSKSILQKSSSEEDQMRNKRRRRRTTGATRLNKGSGVSVRPLSAADLADEALHRSLRGGTLGLLGDEKNSGEQGLMPSTQTSVLSGTQSCSTLELNVTEDRKSGTPDGTAHGGLSPSFLFLQLYHSQLFGQGEDRPLLLPNSQVAERALQMLDFIYPYETHKIGVLYVAPGQCGCQTSILSNIYGSGRYVNFLHGLGTLQELSQCEADTTYLGGLERSGTDGKFAYTWHDEFMQVVFHVGTMMPPKESDPKCNSKLLHIGNDYVTIVYNNSKRLYKIGTIKGQFNYANIIITPLDHATNAVTVQTREDIEDIIGHTDTKVISDQHLAALVRQMAVHANLASIILSKQKSNPRDPYASNWLERLRHIKRIRAKIQDKQPSSSQGSATAGTGGFFASGQPEDFTDYT